MSVYPAYARCQKRIFKFLGHGVTDGCEPPCGFWELNPGLLEEQSVLFSPDLGFILFYCGGCGAREGSRYVT